MQRSLVGSEMCIRDRATIASGYDNTEREPPLIAARDGFREEQKPVPPIRSNLAGAMFACTSLRYNTGDNSNNKCNLSQVLLRLTLMNGGSVPQHTQCASLLATRSCIPSQTYKGRVARAREHRGTPRSQGVAGLAPCKSAACLAPAISCPDATRCNSTHRRSAPAIGIHCLTVGAGARCCCSRLTRVVSSFS